MRFGTCIFINQCLLVGLSGNKVSSSSILTRWSVGTWGWLTPRWKIYFTFSFISRITRFQNKQWIFPSVIVRSFRSESYNWFYWWKFNKMHLYLGLLPSWDYFVPNSFFFWLLQCKPMVSGGRDCGIFDNLIYNHVRYIVGIVVF